MVFGVRDRYRYNMMHIIPNGGPARLVYLQSELTLRHSGRQSHIGTHIYGFSLLKMVFLSPIDALLCTHVWYYIACGLIETRTTTNYNYSCEHLLKAYKL